MKLLRVCILLLLAMLLPVRGAVAAAMLCPPAASGMQQTAAVEHEHGAHDHGTHHHGATVQIDAADGAASADTGSMADKCNLCASSCSVTPLISAVPTLPSPPLLVATVFAALPAPSPQFLSDGQDRPPRNT